ncbi:hypothetical protein V8E54_004629 [Elaphomyces granulatus]
MAKTQLKIRSRVRISLKREPTRLNLSPGNETCSHPHKTPFVLNRCLRRARIVQEDWFLASTATKTDLAPDSVHLSRGYGPPAKSMHPSARSLPPLMIPLPPVSPTNHHSSVPRRRKPFCGSSALKASSTTVSEEKLVLWLQDIVLQLHMPTKSREERRDSVRPRKRKGDVFATDGLNSRGRRSGQGFHCANMEPLLDRTAYGVIRKPLEIHSASPIHLQLSTALKSLSVAGTSTSTSTPGQPLSFWLLAICTIVDLWSIWKEVARWFSATQ